MVSFSCPPPPPRTIFHSYSPTRGIPSGSPNLELHCELQSPLPHQHRQGPSTSTHPARCSLALDHLNPSFPVLKWGGNGYPIPVTLRVPPPQLNRSMLLSRGLPQLVLSVLLSQGTWRLGVLQQEESGFLPAATPPPPPLHRVALPHARQLGFIVMGPLPSSSNPFRHTLRVS